MSLPAALIKEAKALGFNTQVDVHGHAVHVQTEVMGREVLEARTTLTREGRIVEFERRALGETLRDLTAIRAAVEAQHRRGLIAARAAGAK
ncbi:MAG: hypothetical protein OEZ06_14755 [Myxococcales bacterium]|nr:hypothetical protein [Myxococcales bacterium]